MADRNALRLAATLLLIGSLLYVLATFFHVMIDVAGKVASGNDHPTYLRPSPLVTTGLRSMSGSSSR